MRVEAFVDPVTLSQYISHARMHIHPKLTDEAADELVKAYKEMRGKGLSRKVFTNVSFQKDFVYHSVNLFHF